MSAAAGIDKIKNRIRTQDTAMIVECVEVIGGGYDITQEARMVRACLLDVYEEREGEDAVDALMDRIGL